MNSFKYAALLSIFLLSSCGDDLVPEPPNYSLSPVDFFGFALIDTRWDDPTDGEIKTNYLDEVAGFTNLSDILVVAPTDDITTSVNAISDVVSIPMIHVTNLFFEPIGSNNNSGTDYGLRGDYKERWDTFLMTNETVHLAMTHFYLGEEPTWNGISYDHLKSASDYIKSTRPSSTVIVIEAAPAITDLRIPTSVDWVGFNHYFLKSPYTDQVFRSELELLKSKRSSPDQKIVLVMDSHYISAVHGDLFGIEVNDMTSIARDYFQLAKEENGEVVALIGYVWPSGFDSPDAIGARHLPQETLALYDSIGRIITLKIP